MRLETRLDRRLDLYDLPRNACDLSARRLREEGRSYKEIESGVTGPLVVELTRDNLAALIEAGSRLRKAEARALHAEGMTMEQIAELFGVTRQRVSALLRNR